VAENASERVRCSEGFRSRAYRSEQGGSRGKPGDIERRAKAGDSPSSEAPPEVTSFAALRHGERPWKLPSNAKADGGGDSGIERFTGCSYCFVGCRNRSRGIFPARARRTARRVRSRQGSLMWRFIPDEESRFAVGERVRGEREHANSERAQTCFGCKAEDRAGGRRPGSIDATALNKPR